MVGPIYALRKLWGDGTLFKGQRSHVSAALFIMAMRRFSDTR